MERLIFFLFLFTASLSDLRFRRIDNLLNLFLFSFGIYHSYLDRGINGALDGILTALMVFTVMFVFYAGKLIGAGDVKYIMALGAYTGSAVLLKTIPLIQVFSVLTAFVMVAVGDRKTDLKIPMAIPVSLGILAEMAYF